MSENGEQVEGDAAGGDGEASGTDASKNASENSEAGHGIEAGGSKAQEEKEGEEEEDWGLYIRGEEDYQRTKMIWTQEHKAWIEEQVRYLCQERLLW